MDPQFAYDIVLALVTAGALGLGVAAYYRADGRHEHDEEAPSEAPADPTVHFPKAHAVFRALGLKQPEPVCECGIPGVKCKIHG